jgi:predicted lysophospholipase L1 biosynthesis ABC-type transport system permease subunit
MGRHRGDPQLGGALPVGVDGGGKASGGENRARFLRRQADRTVLSGVLTEFAALGFAAGLLASAGASILAAVIAVQLFELEYTPNPMLWVAGLAGGMVLVCASGFIAARSAINAPPADVLRAA